MSDLVIKDISEDLNKLDITSLCIKHIKTINEREFHYADYGSFTVIMIKSNDYLNGYINASKLCLLGKKKYYHWNEIKKSKELIKYTENKLKLEHIDISMTKEFYKFELNISGTKENNIISGTYVHKRLILNIASWISNDFYWKCSEIIESYLISNFKQDIIESEKKIKKFNKMIMELENTNYNLKQTKEEISESLNKIINKFDNFKHQIINAPSDTLQYTTFTIIRLNVLDPSESYNHYITTVCARDYTDKILKMLTMYPELEVILRLDKVPNSKYLLYRIKDSMKDSVDFNGNYVDLTPIDKDPWISEKTFVFNVHKIREENDLFI